MEKYIKWGLAAVAVAFIAWMIFSIFAQEVGATKPPRFEPVTLCHDAGGKKFVEITVANQGQLNGHLGHEGDLIPIPENGCPVEEEPVVDVCENIEGNQATVPEGYSKDGDNCYLIEEPKDYCDTLEGVQAEDEDCPPVEEPTCEELQNCPVVETPPTGTQDKDERPKFGYSQGPNGVKGDGKCQLEWKEIKGSKKVEIRYAEDGIFGNGYKTIKTDDDGAEWLYVDEASVKLRGRSDKTEWSKTHELSC